MSNIIRENLIYEINELLSNLNCNYSQYECSLRDVEWNLTFSNEDWGNVHSDYLYEQGKIKNQLFSLKNRLMDTEPELSKLPAKRLLALLKSYRYKQYHIPFKIRSERHLEFWKEYYSSLFYIAKYELNSKEHIIKNRRSITST